MRVTSTEYRVTRGIASIAVVALVLLVANSAFAQSRRGQKQPGAANDRLFAEAFFERSLVEISRGQARQALRKNPQDVEALFVEMEAAALGADTAAEMEAAVRLLEIRGAENDERVAIAAARVNDLAANTQAFRSVFPRLQAVARTHAQASTVRRALVKAAMDGLPGANLKQLGREAGILTDWRAAGPFGDYQNLDFTRAWPPQQDELMGGASDGRRVELFQFDDGEVKLPDYFSGKGVYYAMAEANINGTVELRLESAGTLEVFVDGKSVLRQDSRFRVRPSMATISLAVLKPGPHRVLVKFLPSATPFRISIGKEMMRPATTRAIAYAPEAQYVAAARKYWDGDDAGAIAAFQTSRKDRESAANLWMLCQAWTRTDKDAPEAAELLNTIVQLTPEALSAEYEMAARANAADRTDEALARLDHVLARRERFEPAQELMGKIAIRLHWPARASHAIEILVNDHPSCDVLRRAQRFFAGYARYDRARKVDDSMAECSPDSIAYANSLIEQGRADEAAAELQKVIAKHPLDRAARELLSRQLAVAGKADEARKSMQELSELAPNSQRYRRLAQAAKTDTMALLDDENVNPHAADPHPFYAAYRRDGVEMVKKAANRRFSGGPALRIVDDQVTRLWPDGTVSHYVHRITRALDRGGVEKYGEVELPHGAEILELRTIRADGTIAEPELNAHKSTISMPGLLPGDAVDEEYVLHFDDGMASHPNSFTHAFGSFHAPILYSRFVVLSPTASRLSIQTSGAAPGITESRVGDVHAQMWEQDDIAQSVEETASAKGDLLPTVHVRAVLPRGWEDVRDENREIAVEATRVGARVEAAVRGIHGDSDEARARQLYSELIQSVRSTTAVFDEDTPTAEETLANHSGSRTAALLAMARAAGLRADLVLARSASLRQPAPSANGYTRPLVRFRLHDAGTTRDVVIDAESEGLAFGALPPTLARNDSLLVTLPSETHNAGVEAAMQALPSNPANEESVARAEVTLDANGDLRADVTILLGTWRGAQMRGILAGIEKNQRGQFYQQMAARIFPGAENVTGEARNEENADRTLELVVHCSVPKFVNLARGTAAIDQLVPALGLKKMYATAPVRQFPLFVDTPLIETATFRIHLPNAVTVEKAAEDVTVASEFGSYSVTFREPETGVLEVRRTFNVPVQVVKPQQYAEFAKFASQIDEAERQKIGLETERMVAEQRH